MNAGGGGRRRRGGRQQQQRRCCECPAEAGLAHAVAAQGAACLWASRREARVPRRRGWARWASSGAAAGGRRQPLMPSPLLQLDAPFHALPLCVAGVGAPGERPSERGRLGAAAVAAHREIEECPATHRVSWRLREAGQAPVSLRLLGRGPGTPVQGYLPSRMGTAVDLWSGKRTAPGLGDGGRRGTPRCGRRRRA